MTKHPLVAVYLKEDEENEMSIEMAYRFVCSSNVLNSSSSRTRHLLFVLLLLFLLVCYLYCYCYGREAPASTFNTLVKDLIGGNPLKRKAKMPGHSIMLKQYFKMTNLMGLRSTKGGVAKSVKLKKKKFVF